MSFSAVILAGGQSRRMGLDKAFLDLGAKPLLARQIETVRAAGAIEIFISGRAGVDYSRFGCPVLGDHFPGAGPLAGIEAALAAATHSRLLVLAVDLPRMDGAFLRRLAAISPSDRGKIPIHFAGIEPLVAFYPKTAQGLAAAMLRDEYHAATAFAKQAVETGLAQFVALSAPELGGFVNWNCPADIMGGVAGDPARTHHHSAPNDLSG